MLSKVHAPSVVVLAFVVGCASELGSPARADRDPERAPSAVEERASDPEAAVAPHDPATSDAGSTAVQCPPVIDAIPPVFVDAPPYTFVAGPSARHPGHGGNGSASGRACIMCHNPGGSGTPFLFAGTVAGGNGVEVRIRESRGRVLATRADADGNFFFRLDQAPPCFEFPLRGGIRSSKGAKSMPDTQRYGNCNGCHVLSAP